MSDMFGFSLEEVNPKALQGSVESSWLAGWLKRAGAYCHPATLGSKAARGLAMFLIFKRLGNSKTDLMNPVSSWPKQ